MRESLDVNIPILSAYLTGEISPGERELIDQWINADPKHREWVDQLQASTYVDEPPALDVAALRARIAERTGAKLNTPGIPIERSSGRTDWQGSQPELLTSIAHIATAPASGQRSVLRRTATWYSATSIALTVLALFVGWRSSELRLNSKLSNDVSVYTTQPGQRSAITLPDGSTVQLSVASRLEVPANYSTGNRTLRLSGEAFLTVAHQKNSPFTIVAGPSTTRVLGTSFLVRAYEGDSVAFIAVRDGKVAVGSRVLSAMQQVFVSATGPRTVQRAERAQFGLASGILAFANTPLQDAIPSLNRWYDVDVRVGDSQLNARHITVELAAGSTNDLIEMLEYSFNIRVVREGRVLTLYRR